MRIAAKRKINWLPGMRVTTLGENDVWGTVEEVIDRQLPHRPKLGITRWMLWVRWDRDPGPGRLPQLLAAYAFTEGDINPRTGKIITEQK